MMILAGLYALVEVVYLAQGIAARLRRLWARGGDVEILG